MKSNFVRDWSSAINHLKPTHSVFKSDAAIFDFWIGLIDGESSTSLSAGGPQVDWQTAVAWLDVSELVARKLLVTIKGNWMWKNLFNSRIVHPDSLLRQIGFI